MIQQPVTPVFEWGYASHIGHRTSNQDRLYVSPNTGSGDLGRLFAVADGMGGQPGGGLASRLACDGLADYYQRPLSGRSPWDARFLKRHLEETIFRIDRQIRIHGQGEVDPAHARTHPLRHLLTSVLGTAEALQFMNWLGSGKSSGSAGLISETDPSANTEPVLKNSGPPTPERIADDGRTMVLIPVTGEGRAFYADRTPVTFHHYTEFLNEIADRLVVEDGIVKHG